MAWLRKKVDPISDRERALNSEIAHLEAQIKKLDARLVQNQEQPKLRAAALPRSAVFAHDASEEDSKSHSPASDSTVAREPIFEDVDQERLKNKGEVPNTPGHYNELGVRKYDVTALFRRLQNHLRGPSTTNPKLVNYLAAGGIQGLRPLRYEKRVARNRFIALVLVLFFTLVGIVTVILRNH